ncbi:SRPBCC family protein [Sphingopyxis terrae]|uniref:Uncharacterized membrane protein n=2 Tax=Sphingopyxis terrae TaxID=33052 RepID=A0A1Y6FP53_9SPHN|nr:SRPBCC family protein [Sphingopyxis terrae]PCF91326.1 cyclase [Sphingopyxis terrae subsp. ummariensis]SMQ76499.1 Uncharacterized membrane protein [Sphingopyxis terrae subsp. ummariensis]
MSDHHERSPAAYGAGIILALGGLGAAYLFRRQRRRRPFGDDAPGYTARRGFGDYAVSGRTVTIAAPREELFAFWRDFSNLPHFMENLVAVAPGSQPGSWVWTIRAPAGRTVDVETSVVREEDGELIAWRSGAGSDIDTEGRVRFVDAPGERGTRVTLVVAYKPPLGTPGRIAAKLLRREPEIQARHDLKRFKMLMETGEIATSARRRDATRAARMAEKDL